jgi:AraC family transcriptional regulator, transcriptional activator of pobA
MIDAGACHFSEPRAGAESRPRKRALNVPAYYLYGENWTAESFGFFHIEPLSLRNVPNNWRIGLHLHPDFHQFSINFTGGCRFEHDGEVTVAQGPCCVFTPAKVVHEFIYKPESVGHVVSVSPDFLASLSLGGETIQSALARLNTQRLVQLPVNARSARLQTLVSLIAEAFASEQERRQDTIRYLLGAFLSEVDASTAEVVPSTGINSARSHAGAADLLSRFRECVAAELDFVNRATRPPATAYTVEFFSSRLITTSYALNTACRRGTGRSARHIIQSAILGQAMRMLLYSNRAVKDIAYQLGYSHPSHFVRFIKQRRGMTPDMIRQSFLEQSASSRSDDRRR